MAFSHYQGIDSAFNDIRRVIAACAEEQSSSDATALVTVHYAVIHIGTIFLFTTDEVVKANAGQTPSALVSMTKTLAREEGYDIDFNVSSELQQTLSHLIGNIVKIEPGNAEFLFMLLKENF